MQASWVKQHIGRRGVIAVVATALVALGLAVDTARAPEASAWGDMHGQAKFVINPGGGQIPGGADGLQLTFNDYGNDMVRTEGTDQYYIAQGAPLPTPPGGSADVPWGGFWLWTGTELVGDSGTSSTDATSWDTMTFTSAGTTTQNPASTATGSGSLTLHYAYTAAGNLLYQVDRTISYTYPNQFFTQTFDVTIPAGQPNPVKLMFGADTGPDYFDQGYGILGSPTAPVHMVADVAQNRTNSIVALTEDPAHPFDGAIAINVATAKNDIKTGANLGFTADTSAHDGSVFAQWSLGTTAGTQSRSMQVSANHQQARLSANFTAPTVAFPANGELGLTLTNSNLTAISGAGYTFTLPTGLTIGATSPTNTCGGTLTPTAGSSTVVLSGVSLASISTCSVTVPVTPAAAGTYVISSASASSVNVLTNGVGTSSLTVTGANAAPTWDDTTLAAMTTATAYADAVHASGSPAPAYTVTAGSLPAGLTLDPAFGTVFGTPTAPGGTPYDFTVQAANGVGSPVAHQFTGTIQGPPSWPGSPALPPVVSGTPFSFPLPVDGTPTPTCSITSGALPAGLTLDPATCTISGTPTDPGGTPYAFVVSASNGLGGPVTQSFSGTVDAPPAPPPTTPPTTAPPATQPPTTTPPPTDYTCPESPIRVTDANRYGATIAWYVCRMHLVGGEWHGENALVLVPAGWFPCPDPPQRIWLDMRAEFGNWLLMNYCAYNPTFARTWFGTWIAFDPPARPSEYVRAAWWFSHFTNTGQWVPWPRD